MKLQQIHANVWIGGLLIILSVIFYMMAGSFSNPDAATWPHLILVCIIILSAMLVVNGLKQTFKAAEPGMIPAGLLKGPVVSLAAVVAYGILMNFTGYFVSTAVFLPLGMFALGQKDLRAILGVTVGLEVFVYILFVTQLQLRMP